MIKNFEDYYNETLNEGKGTHLPDEGDGFADLFVKIRDAINNTLKEMYDKDYSDSEGQWSYDRAGVVIDLIKKKISIKAEYLKKALEDFNHTLEDDKETGSYSHEFLFKEVEKIRDVLQKALDKHLENSDLDGSFYPDSDFLEELEKEYDNYEEELTKARKDDESDSEAEDKATEDENEEEDSESKEEDDDDKDEDND